MIIKKFKYFKINENNLEKIEIETYLPLFTGYYESIFDYDNYDEEEYDENLDYDYQEYFERRAKAMVDIVEGYLKECNFDIKLEFEELIRPSQYNYSNDSINIKAILSKDTLNKIIDYINDNYDDFSNYLKSHYTSYSGFISSHSTDVNKWIDALENLNNKIEHKFGAVLDFILEMNEYTDDILEQDTEDERYVNLK